MSDEKTPDDLETTADMRLAGDAPVATTVADGSAEDSAPSPAPEPPVVNVAAMREILNHALAELVNDAETSLMVDRDVSNARVVYLTLFLDEKPLTLEDAFQVPEAWQVAVSWDEFKNHEDVSNRFFGRINDGFDGKDVELTFAFEESEFDESLRAVTSVDDLGTLGCVLKLSFEGYESETDDAFPLAELFDIEVLDEVWEARNEPIDESAATEE